MKLFFVVAISSFWAGCQTAPETTESSALFQKRFDGLTQNRAEKIVVDGRTAFLAAAQKLGYGKPWVWYAPTFIGKYPNAAIEPMFQELLAAGISIAGIDVGESYGSVEGTAHYSSFYREMVRRGFSRKPVLLAQSRGGLMLYNWAIENPTRVAAIAGIYPVIDNRSYPGGEIAEKLTERNPIKRMAGLNIPAFHIHGDSDKLVPLENNSGAMHNIYPNLTLEIVPGHGHEEIPQYFQDRDLLDFILRNARKTR